MSDTCSNIFSAPSTTDHFLFLKRSLIHSLQSAVGQREVVHGEEELEASGVGVAALGQPEEEAAEASLPEVHLDVVEEEASVALVAPPEADSNLKFLQASGTAIVLAAGRLCILQLFIADGCVRHSFVLELRVIRQCILERSGHFSSTHDVNRRGCCCTDGSTSQCVS